ncbi:hypothetical protein CAPTEDRAFT_199179 [Capitella teleta]|uniref:Uncharacterized protein n=1 Tax=Capitella teleta TaxID=283909 RepID=R7VJS0_CAPTE|nr:hypothetical protein CAPTEDRAFT_199179 [Capitella teleta]|eukprot:ELU16716.1 hypothetical protein CAPTEDRAFT_199179 [Capitella teleta]
MRSFLCLVGVIAVIHLDYVIGSHSDCNQMQGSPEDADKQEEKQSEMEEAIRRRKPCISGSIDLEDYLDQKEDIFKDDMTFSQLKDKLHDGVRYVREEYWSNLVDSMFQRPHHREGIDPDDDVTIEVVDEDL